jgi:hypothetical protein
MTGEEAIELIESARKTMYLPKSKEYISDLGYALELAIKALEQEPCEDCISRAKALEMLGDEPENWTDTEKEIQEVNDYRWFKSILEDLPSVTPQLKDGKWIKTYEPNDAEPSILWMCSNCQNAERGRRSKYCPNCGSYNRDLESLGESFADGYEDGLEET